MASGAGAGAASWIRSVSLCLAALCAFGQFDHDLWTPDEPRVGAVGKSVAEGHWIAPRLGDEPFLEEPPLHAWCVGLVYRVFGHDHPSIARLVSLLFGAGGLVVTYFLARQLAGPRAGWLAALSLGISLEYLSTSHRVVVDGALTFFTTASAVACWRGAVARDVHSAARWLILSQCLAVLAFLTKGPIGLAFPALAWVASSFASRTPLPAAASRLAVYCLALLIAFSLIAGPWLFLLHRETGATGLTELLLDNTLGRILPAAEGSRSHLRPFWYYFLYLPVHLFPATLFVAAAAADRWRRRAEVESRERIAYDFGLAWLALGLAMLTLASTKRAIYLLPIFPAAAIAAGVWLDRFLDGRADGAFDRLVGHLMSASLLAAATALLTAAFFIEGASWLPPCAGLAAVMTALAAGGALQPRASRPSPRLLQAWMFSFCAIALAAKFSLVPAVDAVKSLAQPTRDVARMVPSERPLYAFAPDETTVAMFQLYTERRLEPLADLAALRARLEEEGYLDVLVVEKHGVWPPAPPAEGKDPSPLLELPRLEPEILYREVREDSRAFLLLGFRKR